MALEVRGMQRRPPKKFHQRRQRIIKRIFFTSKSLPKKAKLSLTSQESLSFSFTETLEQTWKP
jgi:hypothetical protein